MKKNRHKNFKVFLEAMLVMGVFLLTQSAFALEESMGELIEGAKKEGEMVFYTSMGLQDCTALLQKFGFPLYYREEKGV